MSKKKTEKRKPIIQVKGLEKVYQAASGQLLAVETGVGHLKTFNGWEN